MEIDCKRLFNLYGYVFSSRRTRLKARKYESLAMLASIVQNVYIDNELATKECLRRCEAKMTRRML